MNTPDEVRVGRTRVSIAGLCGFVMLCGIGFAALRSPSDLWAAVVLNGTLAALALAALGALRLPEPRRASWMGFACFGWIYAALALGSGNLLFSTYFFPTRLLVMLYPRLHPEDSTILLTSPVSPTSYVLSVWSRFFLIGHSLGGLLAGVVGAALARAVPGDGPPSRTT